MSAGTVQEVLRFAERPEGDLWGAICGGAPTQATRDLVSSALASTYDEIRLFASKGTARTLGMCIKHIDGNAQPVELEGRMGRLRELHSRLQQLTKERATQLSELETLYERQLVLQTALEG